jgi:hypothetical protein
VTDDASVAETPTDVAGHEGLIDVRINNARIEEDSGRAFRGRDAIAKWSRAESIGIQQTFTATGTRNDGDHTIVTAAVDGGGTTGRPPSPLSSPPMAKAPETTITGARQG